MTVKKKPLPVDDYLVDVNLLLRTKQRHHPLYPVAAAAIARLLTEGARLVIVPQTLYEFWVVCTRPAGENGLGLTPEETEHEIANVRSLFALLPDEALMVDIWLDIVTRYQIKGRQAHDARLLASMRVHNIHNLLTFDEGFRRYQEDYSIIYPAMQSTP